MKTPQNLTDSFESEIAQVLKAGIKAGTEAIEKDQIEIARSIFLALIKTSPNHPEVNNQLGVTFLKTNEPINAEKFFKTAIMIDPNVSIYHKNLGLLLYSQNRHARAKRELRTALALNPKDQDASYFLARVYMSLGDTNAYKLQLNTVLKNDPAHLLANNDLGILHIAANDFKKAIKYLNQASKSLNPPASTFNNLGHAYSLQGNIPKALSAFATGSRLDPNNLESLMGLALIERNCGKIGKALKYAEKALSIENKSAPIYNLLGTIQKENGEFDKAYKSFQAALSIDKDFSPAKVNRGLNNLQSGKWEKGFLDLEARWKDVDYPSVHPDLKCPIWDGSSLKGKTIFIHHEQGHGDTIQFIRFLNSLKDFGAKIILDIQPALLKLITHSDKSIIIQLPNKPLPEVDFFAPLISLPHLLKITSEKDVSGETYLKAPPLNKDKISRVISKEKFHIGINWSGNSDHKESYKRDIDPSLFGPLAKLDKVKLINLNIENNSKQPSFFRDDLDIRNLISDFYDAAAVINQLDLIISVDTATVHLAGSIGKSCWALIPFSPDWRWLLEREDTPWYDSMRLFRQPKLGDWKSVMENITTELQEIIK